jgi:cytochrome c biogenesis protein CcmG/thiol:disulfide interchange protein DsbE
VAGAIVVAVAAAVLAFRPSSSSARPHAAIGHRAPEFSTVDLDGHPVKLASVKGPVLLNFWASWCVPCRTEVPLLANVDGHGVRVLGVVFRDATEDARAFMRDQGASWPGLLDPRQQIADAYGVHLKPGIPVTFGLDAGHVVRVRHLGPLAQHDLDSVVRAIS